MQILTQRGYDFYEVASAVQKTIRRGDEKLAAYFALELFPKYAEYCWKRLLTISAEDCNGIVTQEVKALYDSFWIVNRGKSGEGLKGRVFISKAVIILCRCGKNRDADVLSNYIYDHKITLTDDQIEGELETIRENREQVPEYVFDCHTMEGKRRGKTRAQFFKEEDEALKPKQMSMYDLLVK